MNDVSCLFISRISRSIGGELIREHFRSEKPENCVFFSGEISGWGSLLKEPYPTI